jgi:DNA-binding NarL/FixJ family response regulator
MQPIRLLKVDDHSLFRESLSRFLETDPDFSVVGQCGTVGEAIAKYSGTRTDVVLLDYNLGEEQGSRLLPELKSHLGDVRVLMVTVGMPGEITFRAMRPGHQEYFSSAAEATSWSSQSIRLRKARYGWTQEWLILSSKRKTN